MKAPRKPWEKAAASEEKTAELDYTIIDKDFPAVEEVASDLKKDEDWVMLEG
jgi:hypothetical protein